MPAPPAAAAAAPRSSSLAEARRTGVVWTLALLSTVGYGALYYAQPLLAVATEAQTGWTRVQTGGAFTGALLVTALLAPGIGRALDRHGGRTLLSAGAGLGAVALLILAVTPPFPLFVLAWLLAGVAMALTFYEATFTVLAQAVPAALRTRATLHVTLVAGLASTLFVPLTAWLLLRGQVGGAATGLAALLLVAAVACRVVLPTTGGRERATPLPFTPDATFARLGVAFTLARVVTVAVGLQLAPLLLAAGHPPARAAFLAGLMGLAALPGRAVFVPLLRHVPPAPLTALLLGGVGLSALLLLRPQGVKVAALGVVVFGLCNGALTLARAELLAGQYPDTFGAANGRLALPVNLAQAVTPLGAGALYTLGGSYTPSLWLCIGLSVVAVWVVAGRPDLKKP